MDIGKAWPVAMSIVVTGQLVGVRSALGVEPTALPVTGVACGSEEIRNVDGSQFNPARNAAPRAREVDDGAYSAAPASPRTLSRPLREVGGDFDGDGRYDWVQGFPDASDGAGRVDVFWGNCAFKVAWPTVLSASLAPLAPPTQLSRGRLGQALAVGDFNGDHLDDLAIGAPHHSPVVLPGSPSRLNSGSVAIIYGCRATATRCGAVDRNGAGLPAVGSSLDPSGGAGALQITSANAVSHGRFGRSLAAGDFNDDGYADLAIGAPGDTVGGATKAGTVTLVYGSSRGLDLTSRQVLHQDLLPARLTPAEAGDHFGAALGAGKLDAGDVDDLVVGVPDEDYGAGFGQGEVDVFWGGAPRLSASRSVRFRHDGAMVGGQKDGDRLGYDLRTRSGVERQSGTLELGLAEAASCSGRRGFLSVQADTLGAPDLSATLVCEPRIGDSGSNSGDGALPEIPVHFVVLANAATGATNAPRSAWSGTDPITGRTIRGANYFTAMIELINQQLRTDEGRAVCRGNDCLRLVYRSHVFYSPTMFESGGSNVCPKLQALSNPENNDLVPGESPHAFTENCGTEGVNACPQGTSTFSNFAEAAVAECSGLLTKPDAFNIIIHDLCRSVAGSSPTLDCANAKNGRSRSNGKPLYMLLDYARALLPRSVANAASAAEEHEVGHAFGLHHACDDPAVGGESHIMESGCTSVGPLFRNVGFATRRRVDFYENSVIEVEELIETAREHVLGW